MSKQFWGVIVVVILIFVGIFALSGGSNGSSSKTSTGTLTQHVEGQGKAGVTLVEYGDYQCPYCGEAYPVIKQVESDLNSQITFQFRNFPLVGLHPNAFAGARAAEAASLQGQFWQMHDLLYEQNDAYYNGGEPSNSWIGASDPTSYFNADAQQLGLNVAQFKKDYASDTVNNLINADVAEGTKLKVTGTPTFFLDGNQVTLPYQNGVAAVEKIITAEIAKKAPKA